MTEALYSFQNLKNTALFVQDQHSVLGQLQGEVLESILAQLVEKIEKCDTSSITAFARALTRKETGLLLHVLVQDYSSGLISKTLQIIDIRAKPRQLAIGWFLFKNYPSSQQLREGLVAVASSLDPKQIRSSSVSERAFRIFGASDIDEALVEDLTQSNALLVDWLSQDSPYKDKSQAASIPLYRWLQDMILVKGNRYLLLRHGINQIDTWFSGLQAKHYQSASANYINSLQEQEWLVSRIEEIVSRFGLPASQSDFWLKVDVSKKQAIQRLIGHRLIAEFFEDVDDPNGRFFFWQEYVDYLTGVVYPSSRSRILLKFTNFLLVEFRDIGNAGYIYPLDEHRWLETVVADDSRSHQDCKDQYRASYRIIHSKNWQSNVEDFLEWQLL